MKWLGVFPLPRNLLGFPNNSPVPICTPGQREALRMMCRPRTQHSIPGQGSKADSSIRGRAHKPWGHRASTTYIQSRCHSFFETCFSFMHKRFVSTSLRFFGWSIYKVIEEFKSGIPFYSPGESRIPTPIKTRNPAPTRYCFLFPIRNFTAKTSQYISPTLLGTIKWEDPDVVQEHILWIQCDTHIPCGTVPPSLCFRILATITLPRRWCHMRKLWFVLTETLLISSQTLRF